MGRIMAKQGSRRLVIDTDVVCSASESTDSVSSACRIFLKTVLDVGHRVVITDAIWKEWRRHRSGYSSTWLTQMYGRKRVCRIKKEKERNNNLRNRIDKALPQNQRKLAAKDVHLIEAAIGTDRLVTSNDEKARRAYGNVVNEVAELKKIVWVNPTCVDEEPLKWLKNGAPDEKHRLLGT